MKTILNQLEKNVFRTLNSDQPRVRLTLLFLMSAMVCYKNLNGLLEILSKSIVQLLVGS